MIYPASQPNQKTLDIIESKHRLLAEAFEKNDTTILSKQVFAKDAWCVGANDTTVKGSTEIGNLFSDFLGTFSWTSRSVKLRQVGDIVWDYVDASMDALDGSSKHPFKILFIWQKVGDTFLVAEEMYVDGNFQ